MARIRILRWLLYSWFAMASAGVLAAPAKIFIVPSRDGGAYAEVIQAIQTGLEARHQTELTLKILPLETFQGTDLYVHRPALIVTVGAEAAQRIAHLNPPAPMLHTLLPRETALEIIRSGRGKNALSYHDSAIFLDQPIGRQLDLVRLALPTHKRVAIILGPATRNEAAELRSAARERSLVVNIAIISQRDELLPKLETLLDDNDVLLSVPEPLAYHSETIHHVLLTTYRYKIPMIGLSKGYVDAGALLAVYSQPEQIGRQVSQWLGNPAVIGGNLPPPSFPQYFTVSVNQRVAASLDLYVDSEQTLQRKLEALPAR